MPGWLLREYRLLNFDSEQDHLLLETISPVIVSLIVASLRTKKQATKFTKIVSCFW